jgi:predicted transposase YdaD
MGQWDDLTKTLVGANPQAFVSLFFKEAQFVALLDKELKSQRTLFADILLKILWFEYELILHLEFQRKHDPDMGQRMWEYNVYAMQAYNCKVASFALYLLPDEGIVEPPHIVSLPDGTVVHAFFYRNVKLWEVPAERLKQPGLEGLLPLLPLTRDGATHETVEDMLASLKAAHKEDLYSVAYAIAALVFKQESERAWLRRRFSMLKDILEESWAYWEMYHEAEAKAEKEGLEKGLKEGLEKGLEKGLEEGERETWRASLMLAVRRLFPALKEQAEQVGRSIEDPDQLEQIVKAIFAAQTEEEARLALTLPSHP